MSSSSPTPTVSVAISTYNREALVVAAVESALTQTYRDFEVIVLDNGSTDGTRKALEPYMQQIRYAFQDNQGRAGGRNAAIRMANGRYVAFLDSDDLWFPDKLERQVPVLEANPAVGLVHGQVDVIDERGRPLPEATRAHRALFSATHRRPVTYADYALECRCLTSTVVVRREVLDRVGLYDPEIELEDLDLYLRIMLDSELRFLDGPPLALYRLHGTQTGGEVLSRGMVQAALKHLAILENRQDVPHYRRAQRNLMLSLGFAHHVLLESRESRRWTLRAAALDPSLLLRPRVLRRIAVSFLPRILVRSLRRLRTPHRSDASLLGT
jgi:glycosyltransferase involved in cell wall biosynthesis